jgi:polysaccharide export outer membrane protein
MTLWKTAALLALAAVLAGCASPNDTLAPSSATAGAAPVAGAPAPDPNASSGATLRLRKGDIMDIRLGGVPREEIEQVTGTYVVDTQGYVNLPHLGRILAAGLPQEQLQANIENAYRAGGYYTHPSITVSVPIQARFVNVGGEVRLPQRVPYTPDLTVVSAISAAGGLTEYASQSRIRLVRGNQIVNIDLRKIRKNPSLNAALEPGDSIEVMRSFF